MQNLLTVVFEAHRADKNHHRRYSITIGRDLLEDWTVNIRYGRIGQAGRELRFGDRNAEAMRAIVRDRLKRRLSAPRRIGCTYRLQEFNAAPGFDAGSWLPKDVFGKLAFSD